MLLDRSQNPYRGLEAFEEEHTKLFFGRQALTEKLYQQVCEQPLTVLLGASGAGKSSLVKAGLIPHIKKLNPRNSLGMLYGKSLRKRWYIIAPIRPGESPLKALNSTLVAGKLLTNVEEKLENISINIGAWLEQNSQSKLLLVIDQAEELLTTCCNEQERKDFLQLLAELVTNYSQGVRIILTLRSDFEAQLQNTALKEYWYESRFIIPRMKREELRSCIKEPASARGMSFESSSLVDKLIDEVLKIPEALPLLSFTLSELYVKSLNAVKERTRKNRVITQADYEQLGGVAGSLNRRADSEYEALVKRDKVYKQTIRNVMLRMLAVGGGKLAGRSVPLSELEYPEPEKNRVKEAIEQFTNARLLLKGQDSEGNPYVEPAHDAFVRCWEKLVLWKQDEKETIIVQRWLRPAVMKWKSQQNPKFLWDSHPLLDSVKRVLNSDDNWLNPVEAEFVRHSLRYKNKNKALRGVFAVGTGFLAVVGTVFFVRSSQDELMAEVCKLVGDYLPYNPNLCEEVPVLATSSVSTTTVSSPETSPVSVVPSPKTSPISAVPSPGTSPVSVIPSPETSPVSVIPSPETSPLNAKKFLPSLQAVPKHYYARGSDRNDTKSIQNSTRTIDNPNSSHVKRNNAYINRGVVYFRHKKYQQAIADYTKVIKDSDNSNNIEADTAPTESQLINAYVNRGIAYSSLQNPEHELAIEDYNKAIAIKPDYADAYINRGIAYSGLGEHEAAIQDYVKAIDIAPQNPDIYYAKAFTQSLIKGKKPEAIENYQKAADLYQQQAKPSYSKNALKKIEELEALFDE